jgi:hypothetical protein
MIRAVRWILYALVALVALFRLLLQIASMPPYAGLDEIYHVARLAFVMQERRQPTTSESSIPPYLEASIQRKWDALPAFGVIGEQWPTVARENPRMIRERPLTAADLRPYRRPNYEAQQPALYYATAAPLATLLSSRSAVSELQAWRLLSVFFAFVTIACAAVAAERWLGPIGVAAAALIVSLPTWLTLVLRASNDAMACAFVAIALVLTAHAPRRLPGRLAEALAWAAAVATKLYTWPVLIVPILLRRRKAAWILAACAVAVVLTVADLRARSGNPLGLVPFDRPAAATTPKASLDFGEIVRVTIASAAWTSGEHWNAMRPPAIALSFGPILLALFAGIWSDWRKGIQASPSLYRAVLIALLTFGAAQVFNIIVVVARRGGASVVLGKEGWYWYVLASLIVPALFSPALSKAWGPALAAWIAGWDVLVHEGALFRDYAGATSPEHPGTLFRWGPLGGPVSLEGIGVGPFTEHLLGLRGLHLAALAALIILARKLSHDGSGHSPG